MYLKLIKNNNNCEYGMGLRFIDADDKFIFTDSAHISNFLRHEMCSDSAKILEIDLLGSEEIMHDDKDYYKYSAKRSVIIKDIRPLWDVHTFKWLSDSGIELKDYFDFKVLYAIRTRDYDLLDSLFKNNIDVVNQNIILRAAVRSYNTNIFKLVVKNINTDIINANFINKEFTKLCKNNSVEICKILFDLVGSNIKDSTKEDMLLYSIDNNNLDICKAIISSGMNSKCNISYLKNKNIIFDNIELLKLLVDNDLIYNYTGNVILRMSADRNYTQIVNMLVEKEFVMYDCNLDKFESHIKNVNTDIFNTLLQHNAYVGVDINEILLSACEYNKNSIVEILLNHAGIDIHYKDDLALRLAAYNNNSELVKLLISKGADITIDNNYALKCAADNDNVELVKLLISKGADITVDNNYVLRCAAGNNNIEFCKYIINQYD